jgi:thiamine biosynthesis lipoprotein
MTMPLTETLPVGEDCAQWDVWGTVARIVVTDPHALDAATKLTGAEVAAVDVACSRFREDSELAAVYRAHGRPVQVSDRLAELIKAALQAADETNGDVDPTLGNALAALGYDRDFATLNLSAHTAGQIAIFPSPDWRAIQLHGNELSVPAGIRLDLGATAKAWTADRCAGVVAEQCGTGVLVALGGDIATAGPAPDGWNILVQDGPDEPASSINLPAGAAIATSSTISRSWRQGNQAIHHILSPGTGAPAPRVWRTVSVVADTCLDANTLSTAAVVRGHGARSWLDDLGASARLVDMDGSIVTSGVWPVNEQR